MDRWDHVFIIKSSGHELVSTYGESGMEGLGRRRDERIEGRTGSTESPGQAIYYHLMAFLGSKLPELLEELVKLCAETFRLGLLLTKSCRHVLDESRSFFRVHTGYFSNIPKCIKAEFIASWACSQSSVVSSSKR
ncbi:hypothetical protein TNCV_3232431 [Trichonephila clavipes]|nr:hypothetical protein TNCV_3232431 [Trichonephila clavipes]